MLAIGQSADLSWIRPEDNLKLTPRGTLANRSAHAGHVAARCVRGRRRGVRPAHHHHRRRRRPEGGAFHRQFLDGPRARAAAPGARDDVSTRIIRDDARLREMRSRPFRRPCCRWTGASESPRWKRFIPSPRRARQATRCLKCHISPVFDGDKCILCGGCADVCPETCLRLVDVADLRGDPKLQAACLARYGRVPGAANKARSSRTKPAASVAVCAPCVVRPARSRWNAWSSYLRCDEPLEAKSRRPRRKRSRETGHAAISAARAWAGARLAVRMVASAAATARYMIPNVLYEADTPLQGAQARRLCRRRDVSFPTRACSCCARATRFRAVSAVCTHLGCTVQSTTPTAGIPLPVSRQRLRRERARCQSGPAPRPLPWFPVTLSRDGRLVIDTSAAVLRTNTSWCEMLKRTLAKISRDPRGALDLPGRAARRATCERSQAAVSSFLLHFQPAKVHRRTPALPHHARAGADLALPVPDPRRSRASC